MEKEKKSKHVSLEKKITACILVIQAVVLVILSLLVIGKTTKETKESAIHSLEAVTSERAQMVRNYVTATEDILLKYQSSLEDFLTQHLNVLLDLYDLSGRYEPDPPLIHAVKWLEG